MPRKKQWGGRRPNQTGRPTKGNERTQTISISLPGELLRQLNDYAESVERKRSDLIDEWIRRGLRRQGKKK